MSSNQGTVAKGNAGQGTVAKPHDTGFWDFGQFLMEPASLSLKDRDDHYEMNISTDIPRDKLNVEVRGQRLTVRGEHKQESNDEKEGTHSYSYSSFSRSMLLPPDVQSDQVSAKQTEGGQLQIRLPKRKREGSEQQPTKVPIQ